FAAWMSTWNRAFAELIQAANLPVFQARTLQPLHDLQSSSMALQTIQTYASPEKTIQFADKIRPQDHLHHPGFYYLAAANYAAERQSRVQNYQEPAPYDDYLCLAPKDELTKVDHYGTQIELFELSKKEFLLKGQKRMGGMISHNIARLKMERGETDDWAEAWVLLKDISNSYRTDLWLTLLEEVLWRMMDCARRTNNAARVLLAEVELLSSRFKKKPQWNYDLLNCLANVQHSGPKPTVPVSQENVIPFGKFSVILLS